MKKRFVCASVLLAAWMPLASVAATITTSFTGSGALGSIPLAASVVFSWDSVVDSLTVTLRNTAGANAGSDVPGSTLTGVFWNLVPNVTLTPQSANVATGSTVIQGSFCNIPANCAGADLNVGGEFGYQPTSFPNGGDRGIASSGYLTTGLPGNIGNFNPGGTAGTDLSSPVSLDGINFGIVTAGDGTFTPNGGLQSVPLIRDAVVFILTGTGIHSLTAADFNNVSFQYGTALSEANVTGCRVGTSGCTSVTVQVPEPGSLALMGLALLGLVGVRRHRSH